MCACIRVVNEKRMKSNKPLQMEQNSIPFLSHSKQNTLVYRDHSYNHTKQSKNRLNIRPSTQKDMKCKQ